MSDQDKNTNSASDPVSEVESEELTPERFREIILDLEVAKKKEIEQRIFSESLVNGLKSLTSSDSTNSIFLNLLKSLKDVLSFDTAMVLKKDSGCLYNTIITTDSKFKSIAWKEGKVFKRLMKGKPIVLSAVEKSSEWQDKSDELKSCASSTLYIPIISEFNHVVLSFLKKDTRFNNSHKELALKIIPLVTSALINAEKNDLIKKKTHELELEKRELEMLYKTYYEQKKSRDQLLESLSQGYLTFSKKGFIYEGATTITEDLLETSLFESEEKELKIWDVIFKEQDKKDNFKKWVDKIFEGRFSFKDLNQLAPKTFKGTKGKHIELEFLPIYEKDSKRKIDKVIMIASDKTQEIELKRKIELDKQNAEFITSCLQNPVEFVDLLEDSYGLIGAYRINEFSILPGNMDKGDLFRHFHTLKARYGQFGAKALSYYINEVETIISEGKFDDLDSKVNRLDRELQDFVKNNRLIIEAASKFMVDQGYAIQVSEVMEKIDKSESLDDLRFDIYKNYLLSDIKDKFERYKTLVDSLANQQGKVIDINFSGDKVFVEYAKFSNFVNVSVHLFRNMVDHGIETEDERIEKTKPQKGSIKVEFKNNGDSFSIHLIDDGGGIDPQRIKEKVLEKNLKSEEELQNLKDSDFVDMIFLPGFSTKEEVTNVSGRGVGMDAVRAEVERLGGTISVSSKIDEGTKFTIKLPILT